MIVIVKKMKKNYIIRKIMSTIMFSVHYNDSYFNNHSDKISEWRYIMNCSKVISMNKVNGFSMFDEFQQQNLCIVYGLHMYQVGNPLCYAITNIKSVVWKKSCFHIEINFKNGHVYHYTMDGEFIRVVI